jgi:hypothetical protein
VWGATAPAAVENAQGQAANNDLAQAVQDKADAEKEAKKKADAKEDAAAAEAKSNALAVARLGELMIDFWRMGKDGPLWRCVNIGDVGLLSRLSIGLEYEPGAGAAGRAAGGGAGGSRAWAELGGMRAEAHATSLAPCVVGP